jgi:hypothetical protein
LLTWQQCDEILQGVVNEEKTIGKFRPFGWLAQAITSFSNGLNSLLGPTLGKIVFVGIVKITGTGTMIDVINLLGQLGMSINLVGANNTGLLLQLSKSDISMLESGNKSSDEYKNLRILIAGQLAALATLVVIPTLRNKQTEGVKSTKIGATDNVFSNLASLKLTDAFKDDIKAILKGGFNLSLVAILTDVVKFIKGQKESAGGVSGFNDMVEWNAFKFKGGLGAIESLLENWHIKYIEEGRNIALPVPGVSYGVQNRDFWSYKLHEIIDVLEKKGYAAHKTRAAGMIMDYQFGTTFGGAGSAYPTGIVKFPTLATTSLGITGGSGTVNVNELNKQISTECYNLFLLFNIPVKFKNITVSQAIMALQAIGKDTTGINDNASLLSWLIANKPTGGGVVTTPTTASSGLILPLGLASLFLFR